MISASTIKKCYRDIQNQLSYMIPEKWNSIYLYSSILTHDDYIETGEMYFYYIPKGILKRNPINVYEIPDKFSIDKEELLESNNEENDEEYEIPDHLKNTSEDDFDF